MIHIYIYIQCEKQNQYVRVLGTPNIIHTLAPVCLKPPSLEERQRCRSKVMTTQCSPSIAQFLGKFCWKFQAVKLLHLLNWKLILLLNMTRLGFYLKSPRCKSPKKNDFRTYNLRTSHRQIPRDRFRAGRTCKLNPCWGVGVYEQEFGV